MAQAYTKHPDIKVIALAQNGKLLQERVSEMAPDAVVISNIEDITLVELTKKIADTTAVFVSLESSSEKISSLLANAGAKRIFTQDDNAVEEILKYFTQSKQKSYKEEAAKPEEENIEYVMSQTIIAVCSPKGGVGKTTLATNIAIGAMIRLQKQRVVLVDFDPYGCNISVNARLDDLDVAGCNITTFINDVNAILLPGPCGIKVVASPVSYSFAKEVTPELADNVLKALKKVFSVIVIDDAPKNSILTQTALNHATHVLGVCNPEGQSIRDLARFINNMEHPQRVLPVLNYIQPPSKRDIEVAEIPKLIERPLFATVPYSSSVKESLHGTGKMAVERNTSFSTGIFKIVDQLCGTYSDNQNNSFLNRLLRRSK